MGDDSAEAYTAYVIPSTRITDVIDTNKDSRAPFHLFLLSTGILAGIMTFAVQYSILRKNQGNPTTQQYWMLTGQRIGPRPSPTLPTAQNTRWTNDIMASGIPPSHAGLEGS